MFQYIYSFFETKKEESDEYDSLQMHKKFLVCMQIKADNRKLKINESCFNSTLKEQLLNLELYKFTLQ